MLDSLQLLRCLGLLLIWSKQARCVTGEEEKHQQKRKKKANPFKSCHAIIDLAESGFKS